ncbi:MAG TPA: molybdopterin cofactor-binding domain-containing protein [Candidatus Sulfopaludibacter sp.]|jgi:isoquinoline 1-oxidoreductase|nr:molybdopterin cofactor-binding domain-containing protein [Candidatus Sulfopaludibacter sp.]
MITRRDFFAMLGGGLVVWIADDADAQESGGGARRGMNQAMPQQVSAWLHIGEDGTVTAYTGKVEVGQNARTSLTQAVAEELRVPVASVKMIMGDTTLTPFDQGTFGSQTTPRMWPQMRKAAASAREMLVELAARKWSVEAASITVADGKVKSGGRSAGFGELTAGEKLTRTIPASEALTPATEWKVAGTSVPKVNGRDIVTGAHQYAYDVKRPGMMYGKVLYPPQFGAVLKSLDSSAAEAMPGVKVVRDTFKIGREGAGADLVGVVAPDPFTAQKALAALKAEWKPVTATTNSEDVYQHFKKTARGGAVDSPGLVPYTVAYIAHVPLEPRAAVAEWDANGKLTVWTGTQRPFGVKSELVNDLGIPENDVHVLMPDTGSGYGGKHNGDAALEAARLAKAAGKPVKRNWTREEELTWAYFRPGGLIEVAGEVTPDGTLTRWEFHNYNSGPSGLETPYEVANKKEQVHQAETPLRQGSYRGLAGTANHFVRESYMDELAHSVKLDPLEFRLKNLKNERVRNVLLAATDRFDWKNRKKAAGRGFGLAAGMEKGGYIAAVAEVSVINGAVKVLRVVQAFECGAVVNPEQLRNQVDGAAAMGIGGALFEHVDFADAKILTNRLSKYRVPRFADMPVIETVLVDRKDLVSAGAGETPIMALAPAIGNAIFDAAGQRLRSLPMAPKGV